MMVKDRWFSAAAIMVLALGIGVNALGFTIINTAFIKGVPVKEPETLFRTCFQLQQGERCQVSYRELQDWRSAKSFSELAGFDDSTANLSDDRTFPEQVRLTWVTPNLLDTLGYRPALGRGFVEGDGRSEAEPAVLLGHDLWKSRFASDPNVPGSTLRLNGRTATVVGVMPEGMGFPESSKIWAVWEPFNQDGQGARDRRVLTIVGRLRDNATSDEAQDELSAIARNSQAPESGVTGVRLTTFNNSFGLGGARSVFLAVMGAVCFVLLIACANVASLLLSRAGSRAREIAIRFSLGATRWRLVRQLLFESLLLGLVGGVLGLGLASAGVPFFEAALPADKPYWLIFAVDYNVVAYVTAIVIVTAMLFGLGPALQLARTGSSNVLKGNTASDQRGHKTRYWNTGLVVSEIALSVVLLVGAGLVVRSFVKLYTLDLGFAPTNLSVFGWDLIGPDYESEEARRAFAEQLEARVSAIPGVELAAVTNGVPPRDRVEQFMEIDRPGDTPRFVSVAAITPRFFETLGVDILRGRNVTGLDAQPGQETVLINQRLADQFFPGEDPIGKRLRFLPPPAMKGGFIWNVSTSEPWRTIVGVTPTIRQGSLEDGYLNAVVYTPYLQEPDSGAYLIVRSSLPLGAVSNAVRSTLQALDPGQPVRTGQTLEDWMATERWPLEVFGSLLAILAAIALTLASVGLYAVMAYSVSRRTREIGVRIAVGAQRRQMVWLVLNRGLVQVGIGLVLGLAGAAALGGVLGSLLVDIQPYDPATLTAIAVLLSAISVAACLVPARRASRIDPVVALRSE
jgi:predicted permease